MIHLDTNYLFAIGTLEATTDREVIRWLQRGEELAVSAIAWSEFRTASASADYLARIESFITGGIVSFDRMAAEHAGNLYRELALKREQRIDCLIAATAMLAQARLATKNRRDFLRFVPLGLKLA